MNEHEQNQSSADSPLTQRGFEDESTPQPTPAGAGGRRGGGRSAAELKANFNSVFGHGLGKASLVLIVLFLIIAIAFAIRGFNKPVVTGKAAQVDVPATPTPQITVDPIDMKEAERRTQLATMEADLALRKGQTYQPGFNPVITAGTNQPVQAVSPVLPLPPEGTQQAQPVQLVIPAGQSSTGGSAGNANGAQATQQQEEQRLQAEAEKQRTVRDKYVDQLRSGVEAQADELLNGKGKEGGMGGRGSYSTVSYLPAQKAPMSGTGGAAGAGVTATQSSSGASGLPAIGPGANSVAPNQKVVFKAGKAIFATLDSAVNTDDGGEVFATVRGGAYNGAKLIGKIEQAPRNIRLRFSMLAPQDDRPTMSINAIAIREDDARQGVAETIDHHTLARYSALFAGSLLTGIAKAAAQPQGDTIVLPNGQVVVSQPELTNKRIAMFALGDVGTNAGQEIRKSFTQPPTYITPANKGIGIIFLTDAVAQ